MHILRIWINQVDLNFELNSTFEFNIIKIQVWLIVKNIKVKANMKQMLNFYVRIAGYNMLP